jgi:hypothetical protein
MGAVHRSEILLLMSVQGHFRRIKPLPTLSACPLRSDRVRTFAPQRFDAVCRFCCKSLFALAIKNSFGRRRDFRVKMWGTSSPEDKFTGDLGNVIESTSIGGRRSDFFTARKLAPGNLGLLQQNLPQPDSCGGANSPFIQSPRRRRLTDQAVLRGQAPWQFSY